MPLPTTGQLSLLDIRNQFNSALSSAPHKLSEYYAGLLGGPVVAGIAGINGAIPSSGTIKISDFRGAPQGFFIADTTGPPTSFPYNYFTGVTSSILASPSGPGNLGTFLQNTITVGATTYTVRGVYDIWFGDLTSGSGGYFVFAVNGNNTGTWWSTITVNGVTFSRTADAVTPNGTYSASDGLTYWMAPAVATVFPATSKTFNLAPGVTYNLTVV